MKSTTDEEKVDIIKPNSKKRMVQEDDIKIKFNSNKKYIQPILMAAVGLLLLTNSNDIMIFACYVIGALIMGFGIYNIIGYSQLKKEMHIENTWKLNTGIFTIAIGLIIVLCASIIKTFLNLLLGIWLIVSGITKLINISTLYKDDTRAKNFYLIEASILILMGLYSILFQNVLLAIIGAWMIISAIVDLYNMLKK